MYKRDAQAESKESLVALLQSIDHLTEIVSTEKTLADVRDLLKASGVKDVKEVPKSDARLDELIRMPRTRTGVGTDGAATFGSFGGVMGYARFNNLMRALTGDLGAFQRTIFQTIGVANRANVLAERARALGTGIPDSLKVKTSYRPATDDEIAEAMKAASAKGLSGDQMMKVAADLAKKGVPVESVATQKAQEIVTQTRQGGGKGGPAGNGIITRFANKVTDVAQGMDMATLVRVGTTVAVAAAPLVAAKLIHSSTLAQIESKRPLSMLNADLAASYGTFGYKRLMTEMEHAKNISTSMKGLLESEGDFEKTLEPIKSLGTNLKNNLLSLGTDLLNGITMPFSKVAGMFNEWSNKFANAGLQEKLWSTFDLPFGPPVFGDLGKRIDEEMKKQKKEDASPLTLFATSISNTPVCPPQRFVP